MSHITRCPACQTLFRVSPEQLNVSQGLVRCGQCRHVFDGREHIVGSLDASVASGGSHTDHHPPVPPAPTPPDTPPDTAPPIPTADFRVDVHHWMHDSLYREKRLSGAIEYTLALPAPVAEPPSDAAAAPSPGNDSLQQAETEAEPVVAQPHTDTDPPLDSPQSATTATNDGPDTQPGFIRHAQRQAFWRRKSVRAMLSLTAIGLLTLLATQAAVQHSQLIAATYPDSRPLLDRLCQYAQCSTQPLQKLDFLTIDSSSLELTQPRTYTLTWSLRNHAPHWQAAPALEISLLNAAEQATIRRIMPASEWSQTAELAPRSLTENTHTLHIDAPDSSIAGYRLMILYPEN